MKLERLVLEKFKAADSESYFRLVQNGRVMKMVTRRALSEQEAEEKFNRLSAINLVHPEMDYFAVRTIPGNSFIGRQNKS